MFVLPLVRKHPIWAMIAAVFAAVLAGWWSPWHADAAGETESVLTPITPCRAVDTREAIGIDRTTKLGASESVDVTFAGGVGDCVLPDNITAVSANIFAVAPTATSPVSFFTVGPADEELSTTSVLNFNNQLPVYGNEIRIPLSADGAATIFNAFGNVHLIADINGYYTPAPNDGSDSAELAALQDRVAELETLLADVTRQPDNNGYDTITFTGVNLQLVDGTGTTYANNSGLGNLILGYNQEPAGALPEQRAGAHNLVIGDRHTYGNNGAGDHASGGIIAGVGNTIDAPGASVTGGQANTASGGTSSVTGGYNNTANGPSSSITGGVDNETGATAIYAAVTGGEDNTASGTRSSVTGGYNNTAASSFAAVTGGEDNTASGARSSITGGQNNIVAANAASITGGQNNIVEFAGAQSVIVGGNGNTVTGDESVVVGGVGNNAAGESSVAVGGDSNAADGDQSVAVGGNEGTAAANLSVSLFGPTLNAQPDTCQGGACANTINPYN